MKRKVLQQTYSPKFNDFALEFYSFVADNYAPFFSLPVECTDRDAPYVLDDLLYNESDLPLEEHYTDTHGYTENNYFYRANRELGRIFKTEHILQYMSDKSLRKRTRRGLLKGEQLHALSRDLNYGKRSTLSTQDLQKQKNSCSCLTLIMACIIYWQAKEINRVVMECDPADNGINLNLIEHISPIAWDNVILYGEYVLNRGLMSCEFLSVHERTNRGDTLIYSP